MSCPCYLAIYSAINELPAAIVALVAYYGHIFSDSEFNELCTSFCRISIDCKCNLSFTFKGIGNYAGIMVHPSSTMCLLLYDDKPSLCLVYGDINGIYYRYVMRNITNIYMVLHQNLSPTLGKSRTGRKAIWRKICRNLSMPESFIVMCDSALAMIDSWLYSGTRTLACPWISQ